MSSGGKWARERGVGVGLTWRRGISETMLKAMLGLLSTPLLAPLQY